MKSSDVRFQPEAVIIFPEFKKKSLVMMLQFLYTGEVGMDDIKDFELLCVMCNDSSYFFHFLDLISASEMLVEFQELCKILKLNPQVRKTKYVEGAVISGKLIFC